MAMGCVHLPAAHRAPGLTSATFCLLSHPPSGGDAYAMGCLVWVWLLPKGVVCFYLFVCLFVLIWFDFWFFWNKDVFFCISVRKGKVEEIRKVVPGEVWKCPCVWRGVFSFVSNSFRLVWTWWGFVCQRSCSARALGLDSGLLQRSVAAQREIFWLTDCSSAMQQSRIWAGSLCLCPAFEWCGELRRMGCVTSERWQMCYGAADLYARRGWLQFSGSLKLQLWCVNSSPSANSDVSSCTLSALLTIVVAHC